MSPFNPILSTTPPGPGEAKTCWSPQLFNKNTGVYASSGSGINAGYQLDATGRIQFYEGSEPSEAASGYIQCTLTNPPSSTYWDAEFEVLDPDTHAILYDNNDFKGALTYTYRPGYVYPYFELNQVHYTDALINDSGGAFYGGNDQKVNVPVGNYIVRFKICRAFTQTLAGPPASFSEVDDTSIAVMEYSITVTQDQTTVQAFTLT